MMKRPAFFGKLMPKEPTDEILIKKYHKTNQTYDTYPNDLDQVVEIRENCAVCSDGRKLPLD